MGSIDATTAELSHQNLNPNAPYFTQKGNGRNIQPRRAPEFDYDLRDLFSDEESATRPFMRYSNMHKMSPAQRQSLSITQQMPILKAETANTALSPQQYPPYPSTGSRTSSALTSPIMTTQIPQNNNQAYPQQQTSPAPYGTTIPNSNTYSSFANQIQNQYPGLSPFSDLDFLDTLPLGSEQQGSGNEQGQAMDPALTDFNMDFAMGMGWDGSLPGNGFGEEGGGVDLFDGFFFGGQQG
jgi:hypothetical protein